MLFCFNTGTILIILYYYLYKRFFSKQNIIPKCTLYMNYMYNICKILNTIFPLHINFTFDVKNNIHVFIYIK